jgi:hypothetical protein
MIFNELHCIIFYQLKLWKLYETEHCIRTQYIAGNDAKLSNAKRSSIQDLRALDRLLSPQSSHETTSSHRLSLILLFS